MKKITLLVCLSLFSVLSLSAQVCQPSIPSSGEGSHNLEITSSDPDFSIDSGECVDLTASFIEVGETNTYGVRSILFNPSFGIGEAASDTEINLDDVWSSPIPVGFNFNFFEQCYNQVLLSTNGAVSFELSYANSFHFWAPAEGALIPNNTDACLKDGNIFGAVHDMFPNEGNPSSYFIKYGVKGYAPFRVFTFTFYNVPHFSCTNLRTSQMIFLYETTNVVEVYIYDKPACSTWAGGRAALGIQNNAGTIGITPPERNTSLWTTNVEAWQFYPDGNSVNQLTWYDENDVVIGTDSAINVCPTSTSTYTAELTYTTFNSSCEEITVVVTRCVTINVVDPIDTDGDGVADTDEDLNTNGNLDDDDTDSDTIPNYLDTDDDGDSVLTNVEINIGSTSNRMNSLHDFVDTDGDLIENYLDNDDDDDGILTINEDYNGNGDPTDDDTNTNGIPDYLETDVALSTSDFAFNRIKVYPNPVNSILNIQTESSDEALTVQIIDLQGKLIMNQNLEGTSMNVSQLNPGVYFLKIKDQNAAEKIFKLVKN